MADRRDIRRLATAVLAAALTPLAAGAQDTPDGGPLLIFDFDQRLSYDSNPDFVPGDAGEPAAVSLTDLTLAYTDRTRSDTFALTANAGLRAVAGEGSELDSPELDVRYSREGPGSGFTASLDYRRDRIEELANLADVLDSFVAESGLLILPADFDLFDPRFTGTRSATGLSLALSGGGEGPLGYGLSLDADRISYDGTVALALEDSRTLRLGGDVALQIDPATRASLGVTYTRYDEDGAETTDRTGLTLGLGRETPLGPLDLTLDAQETLSGTRVGLSAGRRIEGPRTALGFGLGVAKPGDAGLGLTGNVNLVRTLPEGSITLEARQSYDAAADGEDRRVTSLSAGYTETLTPLASVTLSLGYIDASTGAASVQSANATAALSYRLTQDWALNGGVTFGNRQADDLPDTRSETVFLGLGRSFAIRPW